MDKKKVKYHNTSPSIVGVVNITPDSFSGDGIYSNNKSSYSESSLSKNIHKLIINGANIIDIGAESSSPNSTPISISEEQVRLQEVFNFTKKNNDITFSIDTTHSQIAKVAIKNGFSIINDVSGGRVDNNMYSLIASSEVKYVMMYCKNSTGRADSLNNQKDVYNKILQFFDERLKIAFKNGIKKNQIIIDPGMGAFISSTPSDSIEVLKKIPELKERYGLPIFLGASRKGFLSSLTSSDTGPTSRLIPSIAFALKAYLLGVDYIRVHDVLETVQLIESWKKIDL